MGKNKEFYLAPVYQCLKELKFNDRCELKFGELCAVISFKKVGDEKLLEEIRENGHVINEIYGWETFYYTLCTALRDKIVYADFEVNYSEIKLNETINHNYSVPQSYPSWLLPTKMLIELPAFY